MMKSVIYLILFIGLSVSCKEDKPKKKANPAKPQPARVDPPARTDCNLTNTCAGTVARYSYQITKNSELNNSTSNSGQTISFNSDTLYAARGRRTTWEFRIINSENRSFKARARTNSVQGIRVALIDSGSFRAEADVNIETSGNIEIEVVDYDRCVASGISAVECNNQNIFQNNLIQTVSLPFVVSNQVGTSGNQSLGCAGLRAGEQGVDALVQDNETGFFESLFRTALDAAIGVANNLNDCEE